MHKTTSDAAILSITLDRSSSQSLQSQLTESLRGLVHEQRLRSGDRLPASRTLAGELGVSRVTISAVFDQLTAEGYLEARRGSGVYVATDLPDLPIANKPVTGQARQRPKEMQPFKPFETGTPDLRLFPHRAWSRLYDHTWRLPEPALIARQDPLGWEPLRAAIAGHLRDWRGIECSPEQIVITSGLTDAVELISATILNTGNTVLIEEPGHQLLKNAFTRCGIDTRSVPTDDYGFTLDNTRNTQAAKAIVVTPSRQFPLGMTMPLARRLQLLSWAADSAGYIIEDDYDGEFRFHGQPLPAMMSMDKSEKVIYVGSFSKVLMPSLRLGFAVFPQTLITQVEKNLQQTGPRSSLIAQPVLARFISEGHFATHIRRMRRIYAERHKTLVTAINESGSGKLTAVKSQGGMHLIAEINTQRSDIEASARAKAAGISTLPLSSYYADKPKRQGLVLGYAGFEETELQQSATTLLNAL